MPRVNFSPAPGTSTGLTTQNKVVDMEGTFALSLAAMNRSPPVSPGMQRKRRLSGSTKSREELPPPPSRARKIIQMKPKEEQLTLTTSATTLPKSPNRKKTSAGSAASRKMARKTAHSVIERRRRSKMNEEFGVLKDMIPACDGVEMHKLAILQAGIEYVKYLERCVGKLQNERRQDCRRERAADGEEVDEDILETAHTGRTPCASPAAGPDRVEHTEYDEYRRGSTATTSTAAASSSTHPSPALLPSASSSSLHTQRQLPPPITKFYSTSPPPLPVHTPIATGVSPAFNAIHFSPDMNRMYSSQHNLGTQSPKISPLPQAAMSMDPDDRDSGRHAEAAATAALMMLTNDRRSSTGGAGRGGGMSVRDLLSH